jgi:simple sugar transport system permease protein
MPVWQHKNTERRKKLDKNRTAKDSFFSSLKTFSSGEFGKLLITTIGVLILMSLLNPGKFLTLVNFQSMTFQMSELGFFSIAMMFAMISGGIDLSIIGIADLSAITASFILKDALAHHASGSTLLGYYFIAVIVALIVGVVCGAINGILIAKLSVPPLLVTLGTMNLYAGIAIILTKGNSISGFPQSFTYFGNNTFLGLAIPMWMLIAALVISWVLLNKTRYGFKLRFLGSNPVASRFSGVENNIIIIKTYVFSGVLCAIIGLEFLSSSDSASATYGGNYLFQAILCPILASTDPNGGYGRVSCLVIAMLSLQFLSSGFNMLQLGGYYKEFVWGALLLLVMTVNFIIAQRNHLKKTA